MSGHVDDRLSAFMDRELTEAGAAEVRQHLGQCEACAARLAELQEVDRAFAAPLPSSPEAYFDTFAARVRGRIESAPARSRTFRLPAWSWAAAAAVLLGVLLPRLPWDLRPQPAEVPKQVAPRQEAAAPPPAATLEPLAERESSDARAKTRAEGTPPPPAAPRKAEAPPAGALAEGLAQAPARAATPPPPRPAPAAPPPTGEDRAEPQADLALSRADAALEARDEGRAPVDTGAAAATAAPAESAAPQKKDAPGPASARPAAPAAGAFAAPESAPAEGRLSRRPAVAERRAGGARENAAQAELKALRQRAASSPDELRSLRAAWRSFLARNPDGRPADEARVQVVAASVELALLTRDADDHAEAVREGRAYLERTDGVHAERVKAMLGRLD